MRGGAATAAAAPDDDDDAPDADAAAPDADAAAADADATDAAAPGDDAPRPTAIGRSHLTIRSRFHHWAEAGTMSEPCGSCAIASAHVASSSRLPKYFFSASVSTASNCSTTNPCGRGDLVSSAALGSEASGD